MDTNPEWMFEFGLTRGQYDYLLATPIFLLLPGSIYFYHQALKTKNGEPKLIIDWWETLYLIKFLITIGCGITKIYESIVCESDETFVHLVILLSVTLAIIIQLLHKFNGVRSSGLLLLFWFTTTLLHLPEVLFNYNLKGNFLSNLYFALSAILCLLNVFVEPRSQANRSSKSLVVDRTNSSDGTSFLSRLTYQWFNPIARQITSETNLSEDKLNSIVWDLRKQHKSDYVYEKFEKNFSPDKSLTNCLIRTFGLTFLTTTVLRVSNMVLYFVCPMLLRRLILFAAADQPHWVGLTYSVLILLISVILTFLSMQHLEKTSVIGMKVQSVIINLIYRKILKISSECRSNIGKIISHITTDIQGFPIILPMLNMIWSGVLIVLITTYFMYVEFGHAVWPGVIVMFINLIVINFFIGEQIKKCDKKLKARKDERISLINEILNSVKVLKLNTWEDHFQKNVEKIRNDEIKILKQMEICNSLRFFCMTMTPFIGSLATFTAYVNIDETNVLTVDKAFVSLALFNIIQYPLQLVTVLRVFLIQTNVSLSRISQFLNTPEKEEIEDEPDFANNPFAIVMENATIQREDSENPKKKKILLENINLSIPKGSSVAIIGMVGCGKSSLLSAIVDEVEITAGEVRRYGSISYVPQQAWLFQETIENNILFGRPKNHALYERVINLCCLEDDLARLPDHDQTHVSEKGVNLSGGQKQRICLARSIYSGAKIYLFDDPFTAVDHHVAKHIFDNVLSRKGFLANKTRVFVASSLKFISEVDYIINIKDDGSIVFDTYENSKSEFEYLIRQNQARVDDIEVETEIVTVEKSSFNGILKPVGNIETVQDNGEKPLLAGTKTVKAVQKLNKFTKQAYLKYLKFVGYFLCFWVILLQIVGQYCSVYTNVILSEWAETKSNETSTRNWYLSQYSLYGLGQAVLLCLSCLLLSLYGCLRVAQKLHRKYLDHLLKLPMMFFSLNPSSAILQRFSQDINSLDSILPAAIREWVQVCITLLSVLVFLSTKKYMFAIVVIVFYVVYVYLLYIHLNVSRQLKRSENNSKAPICAHFTDTIIGCTILKTANMQGKFIQMLTEKINFHQRFSYFHIISLRWVGIRLEFLGTGVIFIVALMMVYTNESAANVGLCMNYCFQIIQYLNQLNRNTQMIEGNIVAVERIDEYLKKDVETRGNLKGVELSSFEENQIEFKNVSVKYDSDKPAVLKEVSFSVRPREKIGIIGRTGSGKSTVISALLRLIETSSGEILFKNININEMDLQYLRKNIAMVPQDITLFSGTLRNNLDPLDLCENDDEIWQVLESINMKSTILELEGQLSYKMKTNGDNLSMGQKQLINLARVLLRKPKILILDEITSNVDLETENVIIKTLYEKFSESTVLIISHRLQSVMDCDRILILENGEIVENDRRDNLLCDKSSRFFNLVAESGLFLATKL